MGLLVVLLGFIGHLHSRAQNDIEQPTCQEFPRGPAPLGLLACWQAGAHLVPSIPVPRRFGDMRQHTLSWQASARHRVLDAEACYDSGHSQDVHMPVWVSFGSAGGRFLSAVTHALSVKKGS